MQNMTISFATNKENDSYLLIDWNECFTFFGDKRNSIAPQIFEYLNKLNTAYFYYNRVQNPNSTQNSTKSMINIQRNSPLGIFLTIQSERNPLIIDKDNFISSSDIKNALKVAIYEGNRVAKELILLSLQEISGTRDLLRKYVCEDTLNFIKNHSNFEEFQAKKHGKYIAKDSIVFENDKISKKKIYQDENHHCKNGKQFGKNYKWTCAKGKPVKCVEGCA